MQEAFPRALDADILLRTEALAERIVEDVAAHADPAAGAMSAPVIDAHCHAGKGLNYGKSGSDPWTDST